MSSEGDERDSSEDQKGNEDDNTAAGRQPMEALAGAPRFSLLLRENLGTQLSANSPFQGIATSNTGSSALEALQLMRQSAGMLSGNSNPNANPLSNLNNLLGSQSVLSTLQPGLAASPGGATLRETQLRLLLQQQQQQLNQQQQINQLLQRHQLGQMQQPQQVQNQNLLAHLTSALQSSNSSTFFPGSQMTANIDTQLDAIRGLGALGGRGLSIGDPNNNLSSLLGVGNSLQALASLTTNLQVQGQAQQPAPSATAAPGAAGSGAVGSTYSLGEGPGGTVRVPETQAVAQAPPDEQPEMQDAEYFELFGFNDEDGVQIINETFPHKLYRMLFEVEKKGQGEIVSFFPHGKAFIVHQPKRFVEEIMPKYFSTSRMSSFQRQLNLYGFQRIDDGPEKGGFVHQYFQKGQRSLCNRIRRQRNRSQATAHAENQGGASQQRGFAVAPPPARGAVPAAAAAAPPAPIQMSTPQSQQAHALGESPVADSEGRTVQSRHAPSLHWIICILNSEQALQVATALQVTTAALLLKPNIFSASPATTRVLNPPRL